MTIIDNILPFILIQISCICNILILICFHRQKGLNKQIGSFNVTIVLCETIFLLFLSPQYLESSNPQGYLCDFFSFSMLFVSFTINYCYISQAIIFITNYYRKFKVDIFVLQIILVLLSLFQSISVGTLTNYKYVYNNRPFGICFINNHVSLYTLITIVILTYLVLALLLVIYFRKGTAQLKTQFVEEFIQEDFLNIQQKVSKTIKNITLYFLVFVLALVMWFISLFEIKYIIIRYIFPTYSILIFILRVKILEIKNPFRKEIKDQLYLLKATVNFEQEQEDQINWEILYDYISLDRFNSLRPQIPCTNNESEKESFQIFQYKRIKHYQYSSWDIIKDIHNPSILEILRSKPQQIHIFSYAEQILQKINQSCKLQYMLPLDQLIQSISPFNQLLYLKHSNHDYQQFHQHLNVYITKDNNQKHYFLEQFMKEYHQHLYRNQFCVFLGQILAVFSACSENNSYQKTFIIVRNGTGCISATQDSKQDHTSENKVASITFSNKRVEFVKYCQTNQEKKEFHHGQFRNKPILKLTETSKANLIEQLNRDLKFLMENNISGYRFTISYYLNSKESQENQIQRQNTGPSPNSRSSHLEDKVESRHNSIVSFKKEKLQQKSKIANCFYCLHYRYSADVLIHNYTMFKKEDKHCASEYARQIISQVRTHL